MIDKLTRNMTDGTPRDPSQMGSSSHTGLYTALAIAAALVIGFLVYASSTYEGVNPSAPPATATQTQ